MDSIPGSTLLAITFENEMRHHGILGQKWGVRRYQNSDGSLTDEGKKRYLTSYRSDKESIIKKGSHLYRISSNKNDLGKDKIYANIDDKDADFYKVALGLNKLRKDGKVYVQELIAKNDMAVPDKKTMEKIELDLLKDKDVQKELIESLISKGYSREAASKEVAKYSAGKAFMEKTLTAAAMTYATGVSGLITAGSVAIGDPVLAVYGGMLTGATAAGLISTIAAPSQERTRALTTTRISYGDKNNRITNDKLKTSLSNKGYSAMKDYNDRRAYGDKGKTATIVFDSNKQLKNYKTTRMDKNMYATAYANYKVNSNEYKNVDKNLVGWDDYYKDGARQYDKAIEYYKSTHKKK